MALLSDQTDRFAMPTIPEPEKPQLHVNEANNEACTWGREGHVTRHSKRQVNQRILHNMLDMCKQVNWGVVQLKVSI